MKESTFYWYMLTGIVLCIFVVGIDHIITGEWHLSGLIMAGVFGVLALFNYIVMKIKNGNNNKYMGAA